jgi:flagellar motor switch protein FliM
MANVLNQDEINSLLGAMEDGSIDLNESEGNKKGEDSPVEDYDFHRPNLITKDQLRSFQDVHEGFTREMVSSLSLFLRTGVEFELVATEQLQYGEFIKTLPGVTHSVVFTADPLPGVSVFDVNLSLIFGVLDMLLGGKGDIEIELRVPTDIEIAIITPFIERIIDKLQTSWRTVMKDIVLTQVNSESDPEYIQAAPVDAPVVVLTFDVKIGFVNGTINICYPLPLIQAVNEYLASAASQMESYYGQKANRETKQNLLNSLMEVELPVSARLGEAVISGSELMRLKAGDVLVLNSSVMDPLPLNVAGKEMFLGKPGRIKQNLYLKIFDRPQKKSEGPDIDLDWHNA